MRLKICAIDKKLSFATPRVLIFLRQSWWLAGWLVAAGWLPLVWNPDLWLAGCWLAG